MTFVVGRAKIFRRDLNALSVEAQHLDVTTLVSASWQVCRGISTGAEWNLTLTHENFS